MIKKIILRPWGNKIFHSDLTNKILHSDLTVKCPKFGSVFLPVYCFTFIAKTPKLSTEVRLSQTRVTHLHSDVETFFLEIFLLFVLEWGFQCFALLISISPCQWLRYDFVTASMMQQSLALDAYRLPRSCVRWSQSVRISEGESSGRNNKVEVNRCKQVLIIIIDSFLRTSWTWTNGEKQLETWLFMGEFMVDVASC